MADRNEIVIKVLADIKDIAAKLNTLENKVNNFSEKAKEDINKISSAVNGRMGTFIKFGLALQSIGASFMALRATVGSMIRLSNIQEESERKLAKALETTGQYTEETFASLKKYASELQELTGIGDEVTLNTMAMLTAMGLHGEQLKRATGLAQDLSVVMGTDLNTAARVMADAFNGNTGMLSRYIKGLDEADIKQRGAVSIIEQLERAIGGQAEAMGSTSSGEMKKFEAAWGDLMEKIGDVLKKALVPLSKVLKSVFEFLQTLPAEVNALVLAFGSLAVASRALNLRLLELASAVNAVKIAGMSLNWILGGIGLVLGGGYLLWKQYREQVDRMKNSTQGLSTSLEELNTRLNPGDIKVLDTAVVELGESTQLTDEEIKNLSFDLKALQEIRDKQKGMALIDPELEKQAKLLENRILEVISSVTDLSNISGETKAKLIELFNIDQSLFEKPITVSTRVLESELEKQSRIIESAHEFEKLSTEEKINRLQKIYHDFYSRRNELSDEEVKKAIEVKKEILRLEEEKKKEQERLSRELEQLRNNERTLGLEGYRDYLQKRLELIKGSSLQEQIEREKLAQKIADIDRRIEEERKERQEREKREIKQMMKEREMRIQGFANYYASVFASSGVEGVYNSMLQRMETEFYAWVIRQVHLYEWMETAKAGILLVWTKVRMGIELMYDRLKETLHLKEMFRTGKEMVQNAMAAGVRAVKSAAGIPFPGNVLAIGGAIAAVFGAIALVKNKVASLVKMAEGGVVEKATLALIGEMGPEIVAPKVNFERYVTQTLTPMIQNQINHKTEFKQDLTPLKREFKEGFERLEKAIYQSKINEKNLAKEIFRLKRGSL